MPTVGVFAAVFDERGRILCVKLNYGPRNWTSPGGRMESGESPAEALEREVQEETGYRVKVKRLLGAYSAPHQDDLVLSFEAEITGRGEWQANQEISQLGFFGMEELPQPMRAGTLTRIQDAFSGKLGVLHVFDPE